MSDELKRKVAEAINTTGYPLELFISSILSKRGFVPFNNEYFFDFEAQKARTVDIVSIHLSPGLHLGNHVPYTTQLVIECKKSPQTAWVFFETYDAVQSMYSGQIIDYNQVLTNNFESESLLWKFNKKLSLHYGIEGRASKLASNYQVVKIGNTNLDDSKALHNKDTIFEAINQCVKYTTYAIQLASKNLTKTFQENGTHAVFQVYYPIIVYDGPLFNGYLSGNEIELEERNHIVLKYEFMPPYNDRNKLFLIDVVKKEYFEKLLLTIKKEIKTTQNYLDSHKRAFVKHAKSL